MHRVTRATLGTVVIGLVAVFLVAGMVGGELVGSFHSGAAAKGSSLGSAVRVNPANVSATVTFTAPTPWPAYTMVPFTVNFTIGVVNSSIDSTTTTVIVNITNMAYASSHHPYGRLITSNPQTVAAGQTAYSFTVDSTALACNAPDCTGMPQDLFGFQVFVGVNNVTQNTTIGFKEFFVITTALSAALVSPANGTSVSVGNVTLSVAYIGSYIAGAVLSIYTHSGTLVFQQSFIELTSGIPVSANWFVGTPGVYNYSIAIATVYVPNNHYINGTINVITKGGTVYQNSTTWSNTTLISGLSGAAAGTMLLVVGLIVGMIVALVLARAVMGRPAQAPPQPWESKPGAAGGAPNTCSVCGKTFPTPEELAAHGKSEHGMQ